MQIEWSNRASDELLLRIAPLRQLWEARGVGLLKQVASHIGEENLPATATIVPVPLTASGGGTCDRTDSVVCIQAMLVNPIPQLPEVARLAWLLAQLGEARSVDDERVQSLALLPVILAAAEEVELLRFDATTLELSLVHWISVESAQVTAIADTLLMWWQAENAASKSWDAHVAKLAGRLEFAIHKTGEVCDFN